MKQRIIVGIALSLLASPLAAEQPAPPEPGEHPDWRTIRDRSETLLRTDLYDPSAAQVRWAQGFSWSSTKPIQFFAKRKWGWVGCAALNGKNQFGGYVGETMFAVRVDPDGAITVTPTFDVSSKCDGGSPLTPLQPEFVAAKAAPPSTMTDQLERLVALLDRGLITRTEFDQQKAELLKGK